MIEFLLETVVLPTAIAVIVLLSPRLPWSVESAQRTPAWTGGLALCIACIMSLAMVEGSDIWQLSQRWYWLWVSALILAFLSTLGAIFLSRSTHATSVSPPARQIILLCIASMLALFVLRMPGYDSVWIRVLVAGMGGLGTFLLVEPAVRLPQFTPFALAASLFSLAALLAGSGSMKLGLVSIALAATTACAGAFAIIGSRFSSSASLTSVAITMSIALAFYGVSYHDETQVSPSAWAIIALAPIVMILATRSQSRVAPIAALVAVVLACMVTTIISVRSLNAINP